MNEVERAKNKFLKRVNKYTAGIFEFESSVQLARATRTRLDKTREITHYGVTLEAVKLDGSTYAYRCLCDGKRTGWQVDNARWLLDFFTRCIYRVEEERKTFDMVGFRKVPEWENILGISYQDLISS
jgi:hypothetical protein